MAIRWEKLTVKSQQAMQQAQARAQELAIKLPVPLLGLQVDWAATRNWSYRAWFRALYIDYAGFKGTLTMEQSVYGGNRLAELDAGLDIIQEAFANYQTALGNGQAPHHAFNNLKQVLSHAVGDRQVTTVEGLDLIDAELAARLRAAFLADEMSDAHRNLAGADAGDVDGEVGAGECRCGAGGRRPGGPWPGQRR